MVSVEHFPQKDKTRRSTSSARASQTFIQPKLTINNPNDQYEKEADAMADKVMRMEDPGLQLKPLPISGIQRKCALCENEEKSQVRLKAISPAAAIQKKCAHCEDEEKQAQRKEKDSEEVPESADLSSYVGSLSASGDALPNEVKNFYEPRFGYDFSNVRVHTDAVAAESAQSINALAYTAGNHIVFSQGQFAPETDSGKRLLGHELTHTIQQQDNGVQKKEGTEVIQTYRCRGILDANTSREAAGRTDFVNGVEAHRLITERYIQDRGTFQRLNIPSGTRAPYETEGCSSDVAPSETNPLVYNSNPRSRSGAGIPDLLHWESAAGGNTVTLAEIKPATWGCLEFAEKQVGNYVEKGNADYNAAYRKDSRRRVKDFSLMPMTSWGSPPLRIRNDSGGYTLVADWCNHGVIGYLGVKDSDENTILCGASDQGRVDRFLNSALEKGQEFIEPIVNQKIAELLKKVSGEISFGELLGQANPALQPVGELIDKSFQAEVRGFVFRLKDRLEKGVKDSIRKNLKKIVQEAFAALCVSAMVLTVEQLIEEIKKRIKEAVLIEAIVVATALLTEMLEELVRSIGKALEENFGVIIGAILFVVAAIAIVVLLLDDATIIGIADDPLLVPATALLVKAADMMKPLLRLIPAMSF